MTKKDLNTLGYPEAPKIVVTPPGPKSKAMFQKIQTVVPQQLYGLVRPDVSQLIWESAKGDTVRDVDGNYYIDWTAGFHMANAGHAPPQVVEAVKNAISKIINTANWSHELRYDAAKTLLSISPSKLDTVVLGGGSGTEATLAAVEAARMFKKKNNVISLYTHYHGQSTIGQWWGRNVNLLVAPSCNCYHCSFRLEYPDCGIFCAEFIEQVVKDQTHNNTAAVILEPWARYHGTPKGYLPKLKKVCEDNDILMIADEITCGQGRSGKWWACDWENVVPDILCTAKGLTSGLQGNAIVTSKEIATALPPGSQIHSYAANPMTCAAIISTINTIKELDLVNNAKVVGQMIRKRLLELQSEHEMLGSVSAKGLNVGVTFVKDKASKEVDMLTGAKVFSKWLQKGVMNYGFTWTTPPLCLTKEHAETSLDLLEESITEVEKE
jgi:4-aminobutyrate aminotransferase-like enzyme